MQNLEYVSIIWMEVESWDYGHPRGITDVIVYKKLSFTSMIDRLRSKQERIIVM